MLGPGHLETARTRVDLARLAFHRGEEDSTVLDWLSRARPVLEASRAFPEARLEAGELAARIAARQLRFNDALAEMESLFVEVDSLRARRGGGVAARLAYFERQQARFDLGVDWALSGVCMFVGVHACV